MISRLGPESGESRLGSRYMREGCSGRTERLPPADRLARSLNLRASARPGDDASPACFPSGSRSWLVGCSTGCPPFRAAGTEYLGRRRGAAHAHVR